MLFRSFTILFVLQILLLRRTSHRLRTRDRGVRVCSAFETDSGWNSLVKLPTLVLPLLHAHSLLSLLCSAPTLPSLLPSYSLPSSAPTLQSLPYLLLPAIPPSSCLLLPAVPPTYLHSAPLSLPNQTTSLQCSPWLSTYLANHAFRCCLSFYIHTRYPHPRCSHRPQHQISLHILTHHLRPQHHAP